MFESSLGSFVSKKNVNKCMFVGSVRLTVSRQSTVGRQRTVDADAGSGKGEGGEGRRGRQHRARPPDQPTDDGHVLV